MNAFQHGSTCLSISSDHFGGSYFQRKGTRVLCSDGKVRSVSYLAQQADTYFSIPAAVVIRGRYVRGYVCTEEANGKRAVAFRQLVGYEDALPKWPASFTTEHSSIIENAI